MSSLLKLSTFETNTSPSFNYLVVKSKYFSPDNFSSLTPTSMRWTPTVHILNLSSCHRYWKLQAKKLGISYIRFLETVLTKSGHLHFSACLCQHPWQGLTLLPLLSNIKSSIIPFDSTFAKNLFKEIDWQQWQHPFPALLMHFAKLKQPQPGTTAKLRQLQRFVSRMDISGPYELKQASKASICKRFGQLIGKTWGWTFQTPNSIGEPDELANFPWIPYSTKETVETERHLEYPTNIWDTVKPLLREDFERLARHENFQKHSKVARFDWHITLYSLETIRIAILFRNPYALGEDDGEYKPALQQASYGFDDLLQKLQRRDDQLDLPEHIPFISWRLVLAEKISLPEQALSLFHHLDNIEEDRLMELENLLPVPLERYELQENFQPFKAFTKTLKVLKSPSSNKSWKFSALLRPLFLHPAPISLTVKGHIQFLERVCENWWDAENTKKHQYDVYKVQCANKQSWTFHEKDNTWTEYGLFD